MNTLPLLESKSPHIAEATAFIALKKGGFSILSQQGEVLQPPNTTHTTEAWEQRLKMYLTDPMNCPHDFLAVGFEFVTFRVIKHIYPEFSVRPTPVDWDFVTKEANIKSSKLVVGTTKNGMMPAFLVNTTLREKSESHIHPLAQVPLIHITAVELLGRRDLEKKMYQFATISFENFCKLSDAPNRIEGLVESKTRSIR